MFIGGENWILIVQTEVYILVNTRVGGINQKIP